MKCCCGKNIEKIHLEKANSGSAMDWITKKFLENLDMTNNPCRLVSINDKLTPEMELLIKRMKQ